MNVVSTVTKEAQGNPALVRLDPGVSFGQAAGAVMGHKGDFNYLAPYGALVFSTTTNWGSSNSVQTSLQPGNYVALDLTGNGKPVYSLFTVAQATAPAALPKPAGTVSSIEFGFTAQHAARRRACPV